MRLVSQKNRSHVLTSCRESDWTGPLADPYTKAVRAARAALVPRTKPLAARSRRPLGDLAYMAARMMQFVVRAAGDAGQARGRRAAARLPRDLRPLPAGAGGRAGGALRAVRHPVLPDPLPAAQQHPRLAADDRRGPPRGGLRARRGDQQHARDLRPDLPAGPPVRGQLRDREGLRIGHHRRGREAHHRHRLRDGLGQAAAAAPPARRIGRRDRRRAGRARASPSSCASAATRSTSTTATTGSAAC